MWFYEDPNGLACYVIDGLTGPNYQGTLKRSTLEAYLRRVAKAQREGDDE
jgi:hypothetical protein